MFTLYRYRIALTPTQKPYRIGLLFTHKNDDFGVFYYSSSQCEQVRSLRAVAEVNNQERGLESTELEVNIQK